jgi:hypothetical protein
MEWKQIYYRGLPWRIISNGLVATAPIIAFFLWRVSYYGLAFSLVEEEFFGRGLLSLGYTFIAWSDGFRAIFESNPQAAAYYFVDGWHRDRVLPASQDSKISRSRHLWISCCIPLVLRGGIYRYVLAAPPVFLFLSRLGKNHFDNMDDCQYINHEHHVPCTCSTCGQVEHRHNMTGDLHFTGYPFFACYS